MVELVYKFGDKSTASVWKGESTAKMPFKLLEGGGVSQYTCGVIKLYALDFGSHIFVG